MNGPHFPQGMPMGMMMMPQMGQQQQPPGGGQPAVIRAAFEFITFCENVTQPERMVLHSSKGMEMTEAEVQTFPGRALENMECKAQIAALALLRNYFDGSLAEKMPKMKQAAMQMPPASWPGLGGSGQGGIPVVMTPQGPMPFLGFAGGPEQGEGPDEDDDTDD